MRTGRYEYRRFPSNVVPDDQLWCVSGVDLIGNSGVLEWCVSQTDAECIFQYMSEFPQFKELRVHPFIEKD